MIFTLVLIFAVIGDRTGTQWDLSTPVDWRGVIANVVLVQDFTNTRDVSYTFWSIAVEWHIYLLFPVVLWIWRRWNVYVGLSAGVVIGVAGIIAARFYDPINELWPAFYVAFVLGMPSRVVGADPPRWAQRIQWGVAGAVILGIIAVLLGLHDYPWLVAHAKPVDLAIAVGVAAVLVSLTLGRSTWLARILSARWLVLVGSFSYSLYLVHAPLLQVGWKFLVDPVVHTPTAQLIAMLFIVAPAATGVAWCFYWVCERPFLTAFRKETSQSLLPKVGASREDT